ncbi:MAG: murein biosynthesis integral membrane protein MurJ [Pyrinomonadaceae bacterium]|nr:murein biosynthesis integral membrane protein MurJ [Phycisphaerales bacterium]
MPPELPKRRQPTLHGAIRAVSGVTLLSRVGGLIREVIVSRIFGDTALGSTFAAAFAIPNLFRRLFGEGAFSAAFIPAYTETHERSAEAADKLASLTLGILGVITCALTILAEVVLLLVLLLGTHAPERELMLKLVMVMLPFMPAICTAAILAGMLQVHGRFGPASSGPLILNTFIAVFGAYIILTDTQAGPGVAYVLGAATVASGFSQCFWFVRLLRPHVKWTIDYRSAVPKARLMLRRFVPVAIGLGTLQLNAFIDMLIATYTIWAGPTILGVVYPLDDKSNIILTASQRLYQFPLGVFGIAVATAIFPMLSRHERDRPMFMDTLRRGIRLSLFIGVPASVGLALVRSDITYVLYSGGTSGFSSDGVVRAASVVLAYAPGIWAYSLNHLLARVFYALGDTRTPMMVSLWMVGFNMLLNVSLIWFAKEAGLAWATTITAILQVGVLGVLAKRRLSLGAAAVDAGMTSDGSSMREVLPSRAQLFDHQTWLSIFKTVMISALMALCILVLGWILPPPVDWTTHAASLALSAVTGIAVFAGLAVITRAPELGLLLRRGR